jgi:hypothetical protein
MPPTFDFMASSTLRPASLTAATMRSWSISTSPSLTASGSILMDSISFVPRIWTVTTPPPAEASTTIASISCAIFSCMACACFIICWMFIPPGNFIARSSLVASGFGFVRAGNILASHVGKCNAASARASRRAISHPEP